MQTELKIGIKGKIEKAVNTENTAASMGSGELEVFATPAMIALMEETAALSVKPYLAEDSTTVGTLLNIEHISATPVGVNVYCESELAEIEGRKLIFKVGAYDNQGLIGSGTHERFIVDKDRFMKKASAKKDV